MSQYAQYDPSATAPQPVIGWYDTVVFEYADLPPSNALVQVTAQQWTQHFANPNGWTVSSGQLFAPETT